MKLKSALQSLLRVVIEEAEQNAGFTRKLETALGLDATPASSNPISKSASNRRTPAVLDPVSVAREGEQVLRQRLETLSLEQLKDIVADYGMDPGKLVLKWKTSKRIIDRIVEYSLARAVKGDVFLK